ncbi:hypothetical protein [Mycoplasma simbae]|uniref:hypothetical protein n=1 Tax=Mycoplasma simbae TaxID=36744 RepID=UPI000497F3D5|nr:hypothetical protein [Mycoplasma simbae]
MSKELQNTTIAQNFYDIVKSFEKNQGLNLQDIVNAFSEETTKILSKIDPEVVVEYHLDEQNKTLTPILKSISVISDEEAEEYENSSEESLNKVLMLISFISLKDAHKINKELQEGDTIERELDLVALNQVVKNTKYAFILKTIHSSIQQGMSVLRKQRVYEHFKDRIGERVRIKFNTKNSDGSWNVQISEENETLTPAYLPANFISSKREIKGGQYGHATIINVEEDAKLSQVQVSVDSKENVEELFKRSIPEISEGLIEIVNTVRNPGERTKIAFKRSAIAPADFDVYGAVVGPNGQRIVSINAEIGEKIDVILYDEDIKKFIINAMNPARVHDVVAKNDGKYWVIVPKDALTPAIGRKGVNVSLASGLTNCSLDILSDVDAEKQGIVFEKNAAPFERKLPERKSPRTVRKSPLFDLDKVSVSAESFERDVLKFTEQEFEDIDTTSFDLDFEELFKKHSDNEKKVEEKPQTIDEIAAELSQKEENKAQAKIDVEDYRKVKEAIEGFKVDDDLSSFGLDEFDLEDFMDDEDWEE